MKIAKPTLHDLYHGMIAFLLFANVADAIATTYLVCLFGIEIEANPLMRWLLSQGIGFFLLFKTFAGASLWYFSKLPHDPRSFLIPISAVTTIYAGILMAHIWILGTM